MGWKKCGSEKWTILGGSHFPRERSESEVKFCVRRNGEALNLIFSCVLLINIIFRWNTEPFLACFIAPNERAVDKFANSRKFVSTQKEENCVEASSQTRNLHGEMRRVLMKFYFCRCGQITARLKTPVHFKFIPISCIGGFYFFVF